MPVVTPACYHCHRADVSCKVNPTIVPKCSMCIPAFSDTEVGRCLRAIYTERSAVKNHGKAPSEWVPVNPDVRLEEGLKSLNPVLRAQVQKLLDGQPQKSRGCPSKKRKLDMNSVLSDKAEAKVYAAETLPELQAKAQDITEAISKFQMEARKYNAIMDIHVLEQDGFPKVPNFPDLSFDLPSFLELRVPSGSFTPAAQHEPVGSIKVEDTDSE